MEKRVEKKLTCHKKKKVIFPAQENPSDMRLVVLQIKNDLTSKCEVATVRKAGRCCPGCYQSLFWKKETLSQGRK